MKLLTQTILKKLPALYSTEDIPVNQKILQVKFFTPRSNWTWYGVEYDPEKKLFFGYVEGLEKEWGYFSLAELEEYRDDWGLKIERDMYFKPKTFESLKGKTYCASRKVLAEKTKDVSTEDLKELESYLEEREEIEFDVAEHNNTFPPQIWVDESRMLLKRINDELKIRNMEQDKMIHDEPAEYEEVL